MLHRSQVNGILERNIAETDAVSKCVERVDRKIEPHASNPIAEVTSAMVKVCESISALTGMASFNWFPL
jgi:hypothetical protein